jgi:hypothetical protein
MMRVILVRLMIAVALAIGAWWSWQEARLAARTGDAKEQIAILRFADVPSDADAHSTATTAYWLGRYDAVIPGSDSEETGAELLLMAANAAFRSAERTPGSGPAAVQRLDGVLNAYASALKAAGSEASSKAAAYNYEYVARLRDQVARSQGKGAKAPAAPAAASAGDLPAGPTIHGRPGAPPPDAKMEELQMLAPMEFGDREAQPEATPGGKRERKG